MLGFWAAWLLVAHWLDVQYLIMPNVVSGRLCRWGRLTSCCMAGIGAIFVAGVLLFAGHDSLTPTKDPRLGESLGFENTVSSGRWIRLRADSHDFLVRHGV